MRINLKSFIFLLFKNLGLKLFYYRSLLLVKKLFNLKNSEYTLLFNFYKNYIKKGDLVFDIGANIGKRSEVFLDLGASVVCVEPNPELVKILRLRFGKKIQIINCGIGDSERTEKFHITKNHLINTFSNKFIELKNKTGFKYEKTIDVPIRTFDSIVRDYGAPSFTKIDTEGYEEQVLKGMSKKSGIISFEFTLPIFYNECLRCIETLETLEYSNFNLVFSESIEFKFNKWISKDELIEELNRLILEKKEIYGDIYAK